MAQLLEFGVKLTAATSSLVEISHPLLFHKRYLIPPSYNIQALTGLLPEQTFLFPSAPVDEVLLVLSDLEVNKRGQENLTAQKENYSSTSSKRFLFVFTTESLLPYIIQVDSSLLPISSLG